MPRGVYCRTTQHKKALSIALKKYFKESGRRVITPEWCKHISESKKGVKLSKAHRRRISQGSKGKVMTETTRQKISVSLTGHSMSKKTRDKISKASSRMWASKSPEQVKEHMEKTFHSPEAREKQQAIWNSMTSEQRQERMDKCCHSLKAREKQRQYLESLTPEQMVRRMKPFITAAQAPSVRKRRAKTMRRQFLNGERKIPARYGWTKTKAGVSVRSTWEATVCDLLTDIGVKWLYEPKAFDLGFIVYRPDLYLPKYDVWIEIKGYWRDGEKAKVDAFSASHPLLVIDKGIYCQIQKDDKVLMQQLAQVNMDRVT